MFLIYFISYGCNDSALVFLGGAEASASPSFALPMFITIKKIIILHLFLGVPAATVGGTGTPWHTRGYAPDTDTDIYVNSISLCAGTQTLDICTLESLFLVQCLRHFSPEDMSDKNTFFWVISISSNFHTTAYNMLGNKSSDQCCGQTN